MHHSFSLNGAAEEMRKRKCVFRQDPCLGSDPSMILFVLFACFVCTSAQYAKSQYYMDTSSDCNQAGFVLIKTGGVVNVNSKNPSMGSSDLLRCSLQFRPEDSRALMDLSFTYFTISDCDVTLRVEVTGAGSHTLSCKELQPQALVGENGMATISLSRLSLNDREFSFGMILRTYLKDTGQVTQDSGVAVGLIVGIVVGIIAFLIVVAIIGVCCYHKKKQYYRARAASEQNGEVMFEPPPYSYANDNRAQNGTPPSQKTGGRGGDYENNDTPNSKKKLLTQFDQSGSDSDVKDSYLIKNYDASPTKAHVINLENENKKRLGKQDQERPIPQPRGRVDESTTKSQSDSQKPPPKAPLLSALHNNPRFRESFRASEAEAEERARRISGEVEAGEDSDTSVTETWNTTFDSHLSDDDRPPPPRTVSKPPTLPPVPKSPKLPTQRQNVAGIRRAPRPSSSSSEIDQIQNGDADGDVGIRVLPRNTEPPSPSEIVPIRISDPHSPINKHKTDTQHILRPNRGLHEKPRKAPESRSDKPDKPIPMSVDESKPQPSKSISNNLKPNKSDAKTGPSQESGSEYEGRFKKATSNRGKKSSKSPRLGRSRSTGSALDDADSVARPSVPSYKVPTVTADDYEDSDVESNYNPLRRSGSKNSLYASRSSLYGRRRRKNSIGESVYSYAHDDIDYYRPDRESFRERQLSRHDRGFKSLGDLEYELRDQATRSTQTLRECATQTGVGVVPGKKSVVKRGKPHSVSSSMTQTGKSHERKNSASSNSGLSKSRERKNSASSTSGLSKPRERKNSTSSNSGKPKRTKGEVEGKKEKKSHETEKDKDGRPETPKEKSKPKPKSTTRKSTGQILNPEGSPFTQEGPVDQSSTVGGPVQPQTAEHVNPGVLGQPMYAPQGYMVYPSQVGVPVPGQPPFMMPYGPYPGSVSLQPGTAGPISGSNIPSTGAPNLPSKPSVSKWDQLCQITGGNSGQRGDSLETGSVFSQPSQTNPYAPHVFVPQQQPPTSGSDYFGGSEISGPRSFGAPSGVSGSTGFPPRPAWDVLKEKTDRDYRIAYGSQGSQFAPSESNA